MKPFPGRFFLQGLCRIFCFVFFRNFRNILFEIGFRFVRIIDPAHEVDRTSPHRKSHIRNSVFYIRRWKCKWKYFDSKKYCCQQKGKRSLLRKSERRKATKKNIKNQCLVSSSLLQKSERRKEWKEHQKSQFCLIFTF